MPLVRYNKPTLAEAIRMQAYALRHRQYSGCIGHWAMLAGSGSTLYDLSGNGNIGTLTNMSPDSDWVPGRQGYALNLDGTDDHIVIANESNFDFERTQPFSFGGWFRNTDLTAAKIMLAKRLVGSPFTGYSISTRGDVAGDPFEFALLNTSSSNDVVVRGGSASGEWQHVYATYAGTSLASGMQIYVNGIAQTMTTVRDLLSATILNNNPLNIGIIASSTFPYNGDIDDIRVFKVRLSREQVFELYANPWAPYQRKRIWIARPQGAAAPQTVVAPPAQVIAKTTTPRLTRAIVPAPAKSIAQTSFPSLTTPYAVPPAQAKYAASTPRLTLGAVPIPAKAIATATVPTLTQAMSGRPAQAVWQASVPRATTAQMLQPAPAQAVWTATRSRLTQAIVPQPAKAIAQTSVPRLTQAIVPQPAKAIAQTSTPTLTHTIKGATARAIWQIGTPVVTGGGVAPVQAPPVQVVTKATVPTLTQALVERPAQGIWQTSRPIPGSNISVPPAKAIAQTSVPRLTQAIVPQPAQAKYLVPAPVMTIAMRQVPARAIAQTPRPVLALAMQPRPAQAQWSLVVPVLARTAIVLPAQGVWRVTVPTTNDGSSAQTVTAAPALAKWALTTPIVTRPDAPYTRLAPAIVLTITQTASAVVLDYA